MLQFDENRKSSGRLTDLRSEEEERYVQTVAPQKGYNYVNLRGYTINPEALVLLPEAKARAANVTCFDLRQNTVFVAAKNPNDPKAQMIFSELMGRKCDVQVYMCSMASLEHAWVRYADVVSTTVEKKGVLEISPEDILKLKQEIKSREDIPRLLTTLNTVNNTRRISNTLELIFAGALALRASDVHIEPEANAIRVRYRLDGVLHDIVDIDSYIFERMISRLKLLSGMVLNAKKVAQDGRFTFDAGDQEIEIRSSVIPGSVGEAIVMRILDPSVAGFTLENLHLNQYIRAAILEQIKRPNGLIITTGPTGSGKTTALYALIKEAYSEGVKIITIENPVEYKLEGIVQTQIEGDYTFASGLRAILRQDPDIIMVGEIRDHEVAETALHAAQTGHLVFSTLHTNSAAAGFPRLIDLGIDPRIFGTSMNLMLGQRLIRLLCSQCREGHPATVDEVGLLRQVMDHHPYPQHVADDITIYKPVGCATCGGTGYKGRAGIFEGIIMDVAVEEAVIRDPREHVILEAARPQKLPSMLEDGIEKVLSGLTSLDELGRVVVLPHLKKTPPDTPASAPGSEVAEDDFLSHVV